ncbi:MAG: NADP-dependent oxidoreductase [Kineosporiaceae bacterium]
MRGIAYDRFGPADVLTLREDLPDPVRGPDAVVVNVRAAGVNPVDYKVREGYLQTIFPHWFPIVPGWDVAGEVASVGPAVTEFVPGQRVLAYARMDHIGHGTCAQQVAVPVRCLAPLPDGADVVAAGGLPLAGLTADQMLDAARVGPGDTVLVHAAAGGVGHLAVQLAQARGARVIGTASERNHDFLLGLGAAPVTYGDGLDARVRELVPEQVTAVLDTVGGDALTSSFDLVADPSRVVSVVDARAVLGRGGRYVFVRPDAAGLARLAGMLAAGALVVELDSTYPLEATADAHRRVETGRVRGKVVVTV